MTGGSGFLGRRVLARLGGGSTEAHVEVVAPTSAELDLRDGDAVAAAIAAAAPTAIVHTAYRQQERAAIVDATRHVAEAARQAGSRLVHVSSDALFAGRPEPYTEADAPTPVHDYGRWKAEAERIVFATCPDAVVVRTSLLFAHDEWSPQEQLVLDAIEGRADVAFFTDEVRSPVMADDLAAALIRLTEPGAPTGVLHLAGPVAVNRADLAVALARRHGWDESRLRFATIADAGLSRPARVVIDSSLAASYGLAVGGPVG